jgi:hypothetical protein
VLLSFFKNDKEEIILAQKNLEMVIRQLISVRAAASTVQSVDACYVTSEPDDEAIPTSGKVAGEGVAKKPSPVNEKSAVAGAVSAVVVGFTCVIQ